MIRIPHKVEIAILLGILLTGVIARGIVFSRLEHAECQPSRDPCEIYSSHDQPQYHALAVSIVYLLALEVVASRRGALVAAAFYALSFESMFWATRLLSETLFTGLMVASLLLVIRGQKRKSYLLLSLSGVALGLGALVRPIAVYLPFLFVFYILLSGGRSHLKRSCLYAGAMLIALGITILPWHVRNYRVFGHFALSNVSRSNPCWNASRLRYRIDHTPFDVGIRQCMTSSWVGRPDPFEAADEAGRRAKSYIAAHPREYAELHLWGISRALRHLPARRGSHWRAIEVDAAGVRSIGSVTLARAGLLLGFVGLMLLCSRSEHRITALFLLCWLAYFLLLVGPLGDARFRAPLIPVYLIGVAWAVPSAIDRVVGRLPRSRR